MNRVVPVGVRVLYVRVPGVPHGVHAPAADTAGECHAGGRVVLDRVVAYICEGAQVHSGAVDLDADAVVMHTAVPQLEGRRDDADLLVILQCRTSDRDAGLRGAARVNADLITGEAAAIHAEFPGSENADGCAGVTGDAAAVQRELRALLHLDATGVRAANAPNYRTVEGERRRAGGAHARHRGTATRERSADSGGVQRRLGGVLDR